MTRRIREARGLSSHGWCLRTGWQALALRAVLAGARSTAGNRLSKSKLHDWGAARSEAREEQTQVLPAAGGGPYSSHLFA